MGELRCGTCSEGERGGDKALCCVQMADARTPITLHSILPSIFCRPLFPHELYPAVHQRKIWPAVGYHFKLIPNKRKSSARSAEVKGLHNLEIFSPTKIKLTHTRHRKLNTVRLFTGGCSVNAHPVDKSNQPTQPLNTSMGCGSSKGAPINRASALLDTALASHVAAIIGIAKENPEIVQYVSALRTEGWDTPDDFDSLAVEKLKDKPFCFKPGHLHKVVVSRATGAGGGEDTATAGGGNEGAGKIANAAGDALVVPASKHGGDASALLDNALASHIAAALQIAQENPEIVQYVSALRTDGCDTPTHFDDLTVEELSEEPFCFKRLHLKRVAQSRDKMKVGPGLDLRQSSTRGQCNLCGMDVLDSQPRSKDPATGLYQHEACQASAGVGRARARAPAVSESSQSQSSALNKLSTKPLLPALPQTRLLLLPDGKHAFLSYQWDVQEQVKEIKGMLNERQIKCTDAIFLTTRGH